MLFSYTESTEYLLQYLLIDVSACGGFDTGNGLVSGSQHQCGNLIIAGSQLADGFTDVLNCLSNSLFVPSGKGNLLFRIAYRVLRFPTHAWFPRSGVPSKCYLNYFVVNLLSQKFYAVTGFHTYG